MYHTIKEFSADWTHHSDNTRRIFENLTDQSLAERISEEHRDIGRLSWHIVTSISEMAERTGLKLKGPKHDEPVPKTAGEIRAGYDTVAASLLEEIEKNWDDAVLQTEDDMYGEKWKKDFTLKVIVEHEIHHRGQLTVLMRQAGLKIPGIFGPSKEEWANFGMKSPEV